MNLLFTSLSYFSFFLYFSLFRPLPSTFLVSLKIKRTSIGFNLHNHNILQPPISSTVPSPFQVFPPFLQPWVGISPCRCQGFLLNLLVRNEIGQLISQLPFGLCLDVGGESDIQELGFLRGFVGQGFAPPSVLSQCKLMHVDFYFYVGYFV